jgi:hypothetical protein
MGVPPSPLQTTPPSMTLLLGIQTSRAIVAACFPTTMSVLASSAALLLAVQSLDHRQQLHRTVSSRRHQHRPEWPATVTCSMTSFPETAVSRLLRRTRSAWTISMRGILPWVPRVRISGRDTTSVSPQLGLLRPRPLHHRLRPRLLRVMESALRHLSNPE